MINFKISTYEGFTLVEFEIPGGVISPEDLKGLEAPKVDPRKGVILSGRGPIWLYARLVHDYHPTAWVGVFDPRLGGGVVVSSHIPGLKIGDVVKVE